MRSGRRRATVAVLLVALVALLAGACGSTDERTEAGAQPTAAEDTSTTTAPPSTTTTLPPGGRLPDPDAPLRVLLAGDSVMAGLAPALTAAVESDGAAEATFALTPTLPHHVLDWVAWEERLAQIDPEVVVVLVGVWERTQAGVSDPAWRTAFDRDVRDPFAELVAGSGAQLVWVGMPAVPSGGLSLEFAQLNRAFEQQADRVADGTVAYVDGPAAVAAPDGSHPEVVPGDGGPVRVRQTDGTHLCAEGAARLATAVVEHLQAEWSLPVADGWPSDEWRAGIGTPAQCPPT